MDKQEILNRAKDRYIREEVEDSFKNPDASSFVIKILTDYFAKNVAKMNTKDFKDYLQDDLGHYKETVDRYFKEQY